MLSRSTVGYFLSFKIGNSFCHEGSRVKEKLAFHQECVDNLDKNKNEEVCST